VAVLLGCSTANKTLDLVNTCDMVLETRFQTSRDRLDALLEGLSVSDVVIHTTLADVKLVVVLLTLSLETGDIALKISDDLVALGLFLLEGCALIHQVIDLVLQADHLCVHLQLMLFLLLAACALDQYIILQESAGIKSTRE